MSTYLDTELLGSMLRHKRGGRGLREVAREVGDVSPSTLSRIENGKTPDMETFLKLCDWLGENATRFIRNDAQEKGAVTDEPLDQLVVQLRADRNLDATSAAAIAAAVRAMYAALRQDEGDRRE